MSGTSPVAGAVVWKPWQKVVAATCAVGAIGVIVYFFNWHLNLHRGNQEPDHQPTRMDHRISPYTPATVEVQPNFSTPNHDGGGGKQQNQAIDPEIMKSRQSAIVNIGVKPTPIPAAAGAPVQPASERGSPSSSGDALEASLTPTRIEGTEVSELPDPRWSIAKGRLLPCEQVTRINSTLPGGVTAMISRDVRGDVGDVTLLDKGTVVTGVIRQTLMNGADRLGVLWQDATTPVLYSSDGMPHRFRIDVNSPMSDEIGQTGADGDVNRHLGLKIGGILGYSFIQTASQGAVQYLGQSSGGDRTTVNLNQMGQGSNSAADQLLSAWVSIPDVMTRDQGLRCAIYLMRDLNLHRAYHLHRTGKIE